jgi:polar amino acid transport system ATP-binding protein
VTEPIVSIHNVHKSFGDTQVLTGVNYSIDDGTVSCLIGASGSGKSTLLRCVNGLETIDHGEIWVESQLIGLKRAKNHVVEMTETEIAHQRAGIGMVFQRFNLFPHMTAEQNVMVAPIKVQGVSPSDAKKNANRLLARVGLGGRGAHYPNELSGGEQQRVAIARALAMKPRIMLFDEPTSALDPELVGDVLDVMRGLADDGMTMIVVTHEIAFAREVADDVAFIDGGVIMERGSAQSVLDNPTTDRAKEFLARV